MHDGLSRLSSILHQVTMYVDTTRTHTHKGSLLWNVLWGRIPWLYKLQGTAYELGSDWFSWVDSHLAGISGSLAYLTITDLHNVKSYSFHTNLSLDACTNSDYRTIPSDSYLSSPNVRPVSFFEDHTYYARAASTTGGARHAKSCNGCWLTIMALDPNPVLFATTQISGYSWFIWWCTHLDWQVLLCWTVAGW